MTAKGRIQIGAGVVILFALVAGYIAFRGEIQKRRGLTTEVTAKIEKVEVQRTIDPVFGDERTAGILVSYSYEIDGSRYDQQVRLSSAQGDDFVPWNTGKICYDKEDVRTITEGRLFPSSHRCGD